ncbi:MAG: amidohydrolase, partial [Hydrogenovibrio sp.]
FFIQHQDRMLAAIDTYSTLRWLTVGHALTKMRRWLNQLPRPVAEKIAYRNALQLFQRPDLMPTAKTP